MKSSDTVVVLGHPRTGTHMLLSLLEANGYGYLGEAFVDVVFMRKIPMFSGSDPVRKRMDKARRNGRTAISIMPNHLDRAIMHLGISNARAAALEELFSPCVYVMTKREDVVAQAVSFIIGKWSGRYHSHQKALRPPPSYSEQRIADEILHLRSPAMTWGDVPSLLGALTISYEEMVADTAGTLAKVAGHIGANLPIARQKKFEKVSGQTAAEYVEMFKASESAKQLLDICV